jgi:hypothetical protein
VREGTRARLPDPEVYGPRVAGARCDLAERRVVHGVCVDCPLDRARGRSDSRTQPPMLASPSSRRPRSTLRPRFTLVLAATAALTACGGKHAKVTGPSDITGTYTLVSIDGNALPAPIVVNSQNVSQAKSGSLTLNGDLTFAIGFIVTASGHDSTVAATGTYTRAGTVLGLTATVDGLTGTLRGDVTPTGIDQQVFFAGGTHLSSFRK